MQKTLNLIVEENFTLRKQKSEPTAALQSSAVFALHSDKTEPDLLQSHVKEINVCSMAFAPTLFPYLEMGICSLFLRIRSISAIPHSSCVLMNPSVVWFFFPSLFLNKRNSRQKSSPNHVKLGVSWDRLLFQHLSHPLLVGPTPLCSDWSESPKVCQCVHAFVRVRSRESVTERASLWVCGAVVWAVSVLTSLADEVLTARLSSHVYSNPKWDFSTAAAN